MPDETAYQRRRAREDARARSEGELAERERQLSARQSALNASRAPRRASGGGRSVTRDVNRVRTGAKRTPYLALSFGTAAISLVQLARNDKLTRDQKRAAAFATGLLLLTVAFVGELSPGIATGFATLLFLAVLLGGTDAVAYVFETIPRRLLNPAAGPVAPPGPRGPRG